MLRTLHGNFADSAEPCVRPYVCTCTPAHTLARGEASISCTFVYTPKRRLHALIKLLPQSLFRDNDSVNSYDAGSRNLGSFLAFLRDRTYRKRSYNAALFAVFYGTRGEWNILYGACLSRQLKVKLGIRVEEFYVNPANSVEFETPVLIFPRCIIYSYSPLLYINYETCSNREYVR